jgi:hypothetical protein
MTELSHAEIRELLGAFALDAVDGDEYEAVELHLRECPQCRAEVADHREVAALIGHGGAPAPEGVWDRIIDALEPTPPRMRLELRPPDDPSDGGAVPAVASLDRARATRQGRADGAGRPSRTLVALSVAAAILLLVLGGVILHLNDRVTSVQHDEAAAGLRDVAAQALTAPGAHQANLTGPGRGSVAAVVTRQGQGFLLASSAPRLDSAHTYQLWGVVDDRVISLGTFPGSTSVVPFRVDSHVTALAVTEEVAGGVVVSHQKPVYSAPI